MDGSLKQHSHQQQGVTMISSESSFLNPLNSLFDSDEEKKRLAAINTLGLFKPESVPVFDEATQTAAHFLSTSICILSIISGDRQHFKAAVGLSRIGLMNELATSRQMPRCESFCQYVVQRLQILSIEDTANQQNYQNSPLVTRYGIRSYLGVPIVTSAGYCVGTLSVMELVPRAFSSKEIAFLELIARWSISEFERNQLLIHPPNHEWVSQENTGEPSNTVQSKQGIESEIPLVKAKLIAQMSQELRTPLTSIIGMTSVLIREIYGPLTDKQKEYMDIVHNSSQYMHSLVNEIVELGNLKEGKHDLELSPVDIEMLCQQALATLEQASERREQKIRLTVEPGRRVWLLDKNKVRQLLYHLVFRVIQSSNAGSTIRVHVSRKDKHLNLSLWTSHPWLGDGLPHAEVYANAQDTSRLLTKGKFSELTMPAYASGNNNAMNSPRGLSSHESTEMQQSADSKADELETREQIRQNLGLMLSQQLAEIHSGSISLQGTLESGYRYVIVLPQLDARSSDIRLNT